MTALEMVADASAILDSIYLEYQARCDFLGTSISNDEKLAEIKSRHDAAMKVWDEAYRVYFAVEE